MHDIDFTQSGGYIVFNPERHRGGIDVRKSLEERQAEMRARMAKPIPTASIKKAAIEAALTACPQCGAALPKAAVRLPKDYYL